MTKNEKQKLLSAGIKAYKKVMVYKKAATNIKNHSENFFQALNNVEVAYKTVYRIIDLMELKQEFAEKIEGGKNEIF